MLFNSYLFIFGFLPLALIIYFGLIRHNNVRGALVCLTLFSLFFYAWWKPIYLILLLISIQFNYVLAVRVNKKNSKNESSKNLVIIGISLNLLLLGCYKYAGFLSGILFQINLVTIKPLDVILPLAISFFTFQQIAFVVEVSRNKIQSINFLDYCLFITFFPQLIAGPIVHYSQIVSQFHSLKNKINLESFCRGLNLFLMGLFKKVAFADTLAIYANNVFNQANHVVLTFWEAWGGTLAYTLQIYFDFSGYSDMAIGLALLFGIQLPINFNSPYQAKNMIEFWRRWHITLSNFLRDYLYIPLGGNKKGPVRQQINLLTTMLLGGLWHGANWTFILWGCLHGIYLVINHGWRKIKPINLILPAIVAQLITFLAVMVAWVPFRASNFDLTKKIWKAMFSIERITLPQTFFKGEGMFSNELNTWQIALPFIIICGMIAYGSPNTLQIMRYADLNITSSKLMWKPTTSWAIILSFMLVTGLLLMMRQSEFLYFQF